MGCGLDAIERAIRSALERGNATHQAFREKVYRQAFAALERALQANPSMTVETAIRRRKALQTKITEIEAAFLPQAPRQVDSTLSDLERELGIDPADMRPAPLVPPRPEPVSRVEPVRAPPPLRYEAPPVPPIAPRVEPSATPASASPRPEPRPDPRVEPVAVRPETIAGRPEPRFDDLDDDEIRVSDRIMVEAEGPTPVVPDIMVETEPDYVPPPDLGPQTKPPRQRRPLVGLFIGLTVLCLAVLIAYAAYQMGLFGANSVRDAENAAAVEGQPTEPEDFEPGTEGAPATAGQVDSQRHWINVFAANDPSTVSAPGDAKAEAMNDSTGPFIRLTSGQSGSAILFDVGQGVLEQVAGKRATFAIVARGLEGQDTQMSVACNFGELGDCGRMRYAVGATRGDYLFEVDVPQAEAGAGGTIAINSDFGNTGKSVDIFEVKVSVAAIPGTN